MGTPPALTPFSLEGAAETVTWLATQLAVPLTVMIGLFIVGLFVRGVIRAYRDSQGLSADGYLHDDEHDERGADFE